MKNKIHQLCLFALLLMPVSSYAENSNAVFISGDLVNQSNAYAGTVSFKYASGFMPAMKSNYIEPHSTGRFAFILAAGTQSVIDVMFNLNNNNVKLCELTITAQSTEMAVISSQSYPTPNLNCQYSGDLVNDTAVITITGEMPPQTASKKS